VGVCVREVWGQSSRVTQRHQTGKCWGMAAAAGEGVVKDWGSRCDVDAAGGYRWGVPCPAGLGLCLGQGIAK
jgi:hypothetical protein